MELYSRAEHNAGLFQKEITQKSFAGLCLASMFLKCSPAYFNSETRL